MSTRSITLRIVDSQHVLQTHTLLAGEAGSGAQGKPLRVAARANVHYQLTDETTGYAPENIATARVGNQLHIAFEEGNLRQPDLIIDNYYKDGGIGYAEGSQNLIIGQNETGLFYPYVPETAQVSDAISILGDGAQAGQAIGGESFASPWWVAPPAFSATPLLAGLGLLALAGAAAGGGGHDAPAPVTPPPAANQPPVAKAPASQSVPEDTASVPVNLTGTDVDGTVVSVTVSTLPAATQGVLYLADGTTPVTAGQVLTAAQAASLVFKPTLNYNGTVDIPFTVTDNEGAVSINPASAVITLTPVNDPPVAVAPAAQTVLEDTASVPVNLTGTDVDGTVVSVTVSTLPAATQGVLYLADGTTPVTAGQVLTAAQAASLVFKPTLNYNGTVDIPFTVTDNAGAVSAQPAHAVITITPVNDAPAGADKTIDLQEDHNNGNGYTLSAADFGFTDSLDNPANAFQSVFITTLPTQGTLTLNGQAVVAGQEIAVANLAQLVYKPVANANGQAYASFTFQVKDDGGTANGGHDTDASPNTITFNVAAVNDAPTLYEQQANPDVHPQGEGNHPENIFGGNALNSALSWPWMHKADSTLVDYSAGYPKPIVGQYGSHSWWTADTNKAATDVDGDPLTVVSFTWNGQTCLAGETATDPESGATFSMSADGTYTYDPNGDGGTRAIPDVTFTVSDGQATSSTVLHMNSCPILGEESVQLTPQASGVSTQTINVLDNDIDPDVGDKLWVNKLIISGKTLAAGETYDGTADGFYGTITLQKDGTLTTTFDWDALQAHGGTYTNPKVWYQATDGLSASYSWLGVNIAPLVYDQQGFLMASTTDPAVSNATGNVLKPVQDSSVTVGGIEDPACFPAWNTASASPSNTPNLNYDPDGIDSQYALERSWWTANTQKAAIDPEGRALTVTQFVWGGTTYAIDPTLGSATAIDALGNAFTMYANGAYTYTSATTNTQPVPDVTFTVSDGSLTSTATLHINSAPVAVNDTVQLLSDPAMDPAYVLGSPRVVTMKQNLLGNDTDPDGVGGSSTSHDASGHQVVSFTINGTTYAAGQKYSGTDGGGHAYTVTVDQYGNMISTYDYAAQQSGRPAYSGSHMGIPGFTYEITDGLACSEAKVDHSSLQAVNDTWVPTPSGTFDLLANDVNALNPQAKYLQKWIVDVDGDGVLEPNGDDGPWITMTTGAMGGYQSDGVNLKDPVTGEIMGGVRIDNSGSSAIVRALYDGDSQRLLQYVMTDGMVTSTAEATLDFHKPLYAVNDSINVAYDAPTPIAADWADPYAQLSSNDVIVCRWDYPEFQALKIRGDADGLLNDILVSGVAHDVYNASGVLMGTLLQTYVPQDPTQILAAGFTPNPGVVDTQGSIVFTPAATFTQGAQFDVQYQLAYPQQTSSMGGGVSYNDWSNWATATIFGAYSGGSIPV